MLGCCFSRGLSQKCLHICPVSPPLQTKWEAEPLPPAAAFMGRKQPGPALALATLQGYFLQGRSGSH